MKTIFSLLLTIILFCTPSVQADEDTVRQETYKNLEVFSNVLMLLQEHYVDTIDPQQVISGAINGMLTSLDPHSSYMTPDDFKELQDETHGSFSGIGIEITLRNGILTVVSPIEDTPAYLAGIEAGDQIIKIGDEPTKNMTLMDAVKRLRGKQGTSVTISVFRADWQELKEFIIVRDEIPMHSVKSMELEPGLLYVRISNFQANTTTELLDALRSQQKNTPISGLILDLRNNPGGLLDQSVKVADIFLDSGVIVSTKGRQTDQDMVFEAYPDKEQYQVPIIVLVNSGSASASEIVAGALQDHKRAIVLGTETFGKGSVQTIIPMPDGAGLRLTTAKYYTPSGDSIQATGIKPDIIVPFIPANGDEDNGQNDHSLIRERDLPNHLENDKEKSGKKETKEDKDRADIEKRLRSDNQLRTALYILKGLDLASRDNGVKEMLRNQTEGNNR
ncbi:MAG: S41 family peptidase [Desulfobulbaceae bacterium]|nr:S41 family peptidase [Desulfobulbaceae bacterium]